MRVHARWRIAIVLASLTPVVVAAQNGGWVSIAPGGRTRCAFDTPFEFWVREGDPARVFVYLQGGGACWSFDSCNPRGAISFDATIDSTDYGQRQHGIFDRSATTNPFREHTAIFVPYCSGDLHLGTRTTTYRSAGTDTSAHITVRHAGFYNVSAVVDYLASRRQAPARVTIVGASAGGVASPFVASQVAMRIPSAQVRQIADGAGAFRVAALRTLLQTWAVDSLMRALGTPLVSSGDLVVGLYAAAARRAPRIRFSQVGTTSDAVVGGWLKRFGDDPSNVGNYIATSYREIEAAGVCFTGYTLPGTDHTVLWRDGILDSLVGQQPLGRRIDDEVLRAPCGPEGAKPAGATQGVARAPRDAAFLFAYRAKPDMEAAFAEGYRRHLDWHAAHGDSLSWLAWTVIDGPRLGTFVDGTFGIAFKAFDDRVDPKGDGEDATRNVTAFATPVNREVYRLRRDLGTATRLESGRAGRMQRVATLTLRPGSERAVEAALRAIATSRSTGADFAVYERVSGGDPAFVIIQQFDTWSELEDAGHDVARAAIRGAGSAVIRAEREVWSYLPSLSYLPKR